MTDYAVKEECGVQVFPFICLFGEELLDAPKGTTRITDVNLETTDDN